MEHIVQIGVSVDDDRIEKAAELVAESIKRSKAYREKVKEITA